MRSPLLNTLAEAPPATDIFALLCQAAFDGVLVHDDGIIVQVSETCAAIFGSDVAAVLGRKIVQFIAPEMREQFHDDSPETVVLRINGDRVPVQTRGVTIPGSSLRILVLRDLSGSRLHERQQRNGEDRLRTLAHVAFDGMCVHKDGRLIEVNDAFAAIFGYAVEDLIGMPYEALIAVEERAHVREHVRLKDTTRYDTSALRKDGTTLTVEVCGTSIPNGERVVAIRDISKRRQSEDALRASEDRYRDLVENSHDLIGTHDLNGTILSANAAAGKALHVPAAELLGHNVTEHFRAGNEPLFAEYVRRLRDEGSADGTITIVASDGSSTLWEYNTCVRTEGVSAPIARVLARDITEREESHAAVRRSEARFRTIIENASDLIAIIDPDGAVRYFSPSMDRLLGISAESMTGTAFIDLVHEGDGQRASQFLKHHVEDPAADGRIEIRLRHHDGSWRSFEVVARNVVADGVVTAIITSRNWRRRTASAAWDAWRPRWPTSSTMCSWACSPSPS